MMRISSKHTALKSSLLLSLSLFCASSAFATQLQCQNKDFTLQTLGSGGPISDDQRASSAEVIWLNGKSALLIDAGGGAYLRFGQAGAKLEELKLIGLTHFHTDHTADLAAILKGGFFVSEPQKLTLAGPERGGAFPSMTEHFSALFNAQNGAFAYLNGLYQATDGIQIATDLKDISYTSNTPVVVYQDGDVKVTAIGIPHGDVPCLAYRIDSEKGSIVISADQNGSDSRFIDFAKGTDILVMPSAIDEHADSASKFMHASPETVGKLANAINPKVLVLNHFMGKSLKAKDQSIDIIKQFYHGKIYASRDLSCFPISLANSPE